jgi:hypothetical protein
MSENFYKDYLYPLQDKVLRVIDDAGTEFYLTGRTASGRCYLEHRYSDDLDLFQNRSQSFSRDAEKIIQILSETFVLRYGTKDEAFYRVFVRENPKDPELKLEFINDVFFHKGELIKHQLFSKVDSWMNILSNKVTALSRCAPKDVADILFICFKYAFSWKEVIEDARMKDAWINEIVASETLYEFDPASLSQVQWINKNNTSKLFAEELKIIARELLHGIDNSLVTK